MASPSEMGANDFPPPPEVEVTAEVPVAEPFSDDDIPF